MTPRERQRLRVEIHRWRKDPTRNLSPAARELAQQILIAAELKRLRAVRAPVNPLTAEERQILQAMLDRKVLVFDRSA